MKQKRIRAPKRGTPSATTQKIIDHLLRLADPDRRDDPEVETTMLVMMRVQRRTIREVVKRFVGVIDLVADVDAKRTVVDFKTSGAAYEDHEVQLSDQLTAYQLAEPAAEQTALCVFVKTKEPKIEWHNASRTGEQLTEFLRKVGFVAQDIAAERFYKRPGKWCSWCDYLPVCTGEKQRADETLVQIH